MDYFTLNLQYRQICYLWKCFNEYTEAWVFCHNSGKVNSFICSSGQTTLQANDSPIYLYDFHILWALEIFDYKGMHLFHISTVYLLLYIFKFEPKTKGVQNEKSRKIKFENNTWYFYLKVLYGA